MPTFLLNYPLPVSIVYFLLSMFQPFVEPGHSIFKLFLPQTYAIAIPATVLVFAIVLIGMFVGLVLAKEAAKKRKSN